MRNCLNCHTLTSNPKFCSRSCSATYNNKLNPKRLPENNCITCNKQITTRLTYCKQCYEQEKIVDQETRTLEYYQGKRQYQRNSQIRNFARKKVVSSDIEFRCQSCGYDKHVHVCHFIAISEFPATTTISEINDINNLLILCPNCHWELDNGHMIFIR